MKKIESLKSEKFKGNVINDLSSVIGGHIFWRFTNNVSVTNYSDCGDTNVSTFSCDTAKDGHTTGSTDNCI